MNVNADKHQAKLLEWTVRGRVVAFCFFLIWLDLFIKSWKWDKEDKEKERKKQEEQDRLRNLK